MLFVMHLCVSLSLHYTAVIILLFLFYFALFFGMNIFRQEDGAYSDDGIINSFLSWAVSTFNSVLKLGILIWGSKGFALVGFSWNFRLRN